MDRALDFKAEGSGFKHSVGSSACSKIPSTGISSGEVDSYLQGMGQYWTHQSMDRINDQHYIMLVSTKIRTCHMIVLPAKTHIKYVSPKLNNVKVVGKATFVAR